MRNKLRLVGYPLFSPLLFGSLLFGGYSIAKQGLLTRDEMLDQLVMARLSALTMA